MGSIKIFTKKGATTVNVSIAVAILGILVLFGFGIGASFFGLLNWGDNAPFGGAISCPAWANAPSGYQQAFEAAAATTKKSDNTQLQPALLAAIFLSEHGDNWPTWGPEEYEKWLTAHPTYNDFKGYAPFQFELATWDGLTNKADEKDMMRFDKAAAAAAKFIANILSNAGIPINTTNENEVKCAGVGYNSGPNDCRDWKKSNYQGSVVVTNNYHMRTWQHFQDLINGCTGSTGNRFTSLKQVQMLYGPTQADVERHLVSVTFLGHSIRVNKVMATDLQKVEQAIKQSGVNYPFDNVSGYNYRTNRNNSADMSPHAYGLAINVYDTFDNNPNIQRPSDSAPRDPNACKHNIPDQVVNAFKSNGFFWGAEFADVCDPMHFQYGGNWS